MTMTTKTSTTPTTAVPAIRASCSRQLSFSGGEKLVIKRSRRPLGTPHQPQGTGCVPLRTGPQ